MKILGIDYGRAKVGLAIGVNGFVEPFKVIHYNNEDKLFAEIKNIVRTEEIEKVVVGISEGEMAKETNDFVSKLLETLSVSVDTFDETLTSQEAQRISHEAGVPQKKRHEMEDAYAATIMLQNYLDSDI